MFGPRRLPFACAAIAIAASSCFSPGDGPDPPPTELYYPAGLAVSPGGHTLYIANSDFDLQYNAGTLMAVDLDRLRNIIRPLRETGDCGALPKNNARVLNPGPCGPIHLNNPPDQQGSLVASSVQIGAFASDILMLARKDEGKPGARLFLPVRGDPSITWIDVQDDRYETGSLDRALRCGQANAASRCDSVHRAGEDPTSNLRGLVLPPEPYGMAATWDGTALLVTHQTTSSVSLVTHPWDGVPALQFVLTGLAPGPIGVSALPVPGYVAKSGIDYQPGFVTTYRGAAQVDLVRFYDDRAAAPARPFVVRSDSTGITVNSSGIDSRGIAVDGMARSACEASCQQGLKCLQACATAVPLQIYVANRTPPSLLVGETRTSFGAVPPNDRVAFYDTIPLAYGPSRVALGSIATPSGARIQRVFVSCFDARFVVVYDPAGRRVEGRIRTGRGPHALAFDPVEPLLYVGHFTDSYIGIVDLDASKPATYLTMVATVGIPKPPRESK